MEFEIKHIAIYYYQLPFAPPKMKYLGLNVTKYVQDLNEENYKTGKCIKEELSNWKDIP